ncbi:hypothetical protein AMTRI_Chr06g196670 [Amborella trichopoda]
MRTALDVILASHNKINMHECVNCCTHCKISITLRFVRKRRWRLHIKSEVLISMCRCFYICFIYACYVDECYPFVFTSTENLAFSCNIDNGFLFCFSCICFSTFSFLVNCILYTLYNC